MDDEDLRELCRMLVLQLRRLTAVLWCTLGLTLLTLLVVLLR